MLIKYTIKKLLQDKYWKSTIPLPHDTESVESSAEL